VTSDARPAARIIRGTGAGLVYRHPDAAGLAAAIEQLADRDRRRACGERGRAAVRDTYHWERDVARLLETVRRVVAVRAPDGFPGRRA
jgi:glycosyltransferase involved in cell wall biosynthesis